MVAICIWLITLLSGPLSHPGGLHSKEQLEKIRKSFSQGDEMLLNSREKLVAQATEHLDYNPDAPEDFNVPGYYDDPAQHRAAMGQLSNDAWAAYSCALAWQLADKDARENFALKALEIVENWATVNKGTSGYDGELAMVDAGVGLVFAAELLRDNTGWTDELHESFSNWLSKVYLKCCDNIVYEPNNWGDWGILGRSAAHYFLEDMDALADDYQILEVRIDKTIDADGSMPEEVKRGKRGLWYTYFALAPMTAACQIVEEALEVDLFEYKGMDGAGIEEALDYLLKYTLSPDEWPHYIGDDLNQGKPRSYPGNLFEAMYPIYKKPEYQDYVSTVQPVMVYGHHYAWAVPGLSF